jgi:hypothetical protein
VHTASAVSRSRAPSSMVRSGGSSRWHARSDPAPFHLT